MPPPGDLPFQLRRRVVRVVHLEEAEIHEEGIGIVGMRLEPVDGLGAHLVVAGGKVGVGELLLHGDRRLPRLAVPLRQVDLGPDLHELLVVLGEVRMQRQVVIGVDARVIGQHVVHLVEAVGGRKVLRLVADMPLAELHGWCSPPASDIARWWASAW